MKTHARAVLELVLKQAQRSRASEVRFSSGMYPAVVVQGGPRFVEGAELKLETVRNIHHECLLLADRSELISRTNASYPFVSPKLGRYLCKYRVRGNTASLTLLPEPDATEEVAVARPGKSPRLRAETRPNESDTEKKGTN
jgi:hypothetical protein